MRKKDGGRCCLEISSVFLYTQISKNMVYYKSNKLL